MELTTGITILISALFTYWGAWISSAETALFSLSPLKVLTYRDSKDPTKRLLAALLAHPKDLLVTIFMINTFTNIMLQNIVSGLFGEEGRWELKIGVPLLLTLILGEIIPKYIGLQNNFSISYKVTPKINFLQNLLKPARKLVIWITNPVSRCIFFFLKKDREITPEELEHVLETSEKRGILSAEINELIRGYLAIQKTTVKELMWPKEDIIYYEISQPLSKLSHLFSDEECSRIPVVENNLDSVLGVITASQYFKHQHEINQPSDVKEFLEKPYFIPETMSSKLLLRRFDEKGEVFGIVVDEYGSISGLITKEDLIEVVVGDIEDSRDQQQFFAKAGKDEVISSGKWELTEFNEHFHSNLRSASMLTIGGWITEQLGTIPKSGTKWEAEGFLFQILAASPNRITRLFIRRLK
ncbi:MAG: hemolysin family protein [Parachlamydiaceae bacterium]